MSNIHVIYQLVFCFGKALSQRCQRDVKRQCKEVTVASRAVAAYVGVPTFLPPIFPAKDLSQAILASFLPAKPGKDGLPFPSQAVSLTPSRQYDTNKAKLERPLPCLDMIRSRPTLTPEQRHALTQIPSDLSDRDIARHYTFTEKERELINRRRRASNRLGFAVQLALLKFPGRTLMEVKEVPRAGAHRHRRASRCPCFCLYQLW